MKTRDTYTAEERAAKLAAMSQLADAFYFSAVQIQCHAFIEFTGLMNEFLKACAREDDAGRGGWIFANGHGENVPLLEHEVEYIREKLHCIFGDQLFKGPRE